MQTSQVSKCTEDTDSTYGITKTLQTSPHRSLTNHCWTWHKLYLSESLTVQRRFHRTGHWISHRSELWTARHCKLRMSAQWVATKCSVVQSYIKVSSCFCLISESQRVVCTFPNGFLRSMVGILASFVIVLNLESIHHKWRFDGRLGSCK